jgi:hypothetical protein
MELNISSNDGWSFAIAISHEGKTLSGVVELLDPIEGEPERNRSWNLFVDNEPYAELGGYRMEWPEALKRGLKLLNESVREQ